MKKGFLLLLLFCVLKGYGEISPQYNLSTQTGSENPWLGELWYPITYSGSNYFFTDISASYSTYKYTRSVEFGNVVRQVSPKDWAWGSYAYVSYNRSLLAHHFYTLNPGLEFLNTRWHVSWNAYLPINSAQQKNENLLWADEVGIYQYVKFRQHQQLNKKVQLVSNTGMGSDFILGYRFASLANTKFSTGIYYFNMPSHPLGFVAIAESPPLNHISFNLGFSHDPLTKNTVTLGIKLHLDKKLHSWLEQKTQHNLPLITQANTIPISTGYQPNGSYLVQKDNIWFFNANAAPSTKPLNLEFCTYERPCPTLNNEVTFQIAQISKSSPFRDTPSLYLNPGVYSSIYLSLFNNESISGRTKGYVLPAFGTNRPQIKTNELIINGFDGNASNTVANVAFYNNGGNVSAVVINEARQVYIDNVQIGVMDKINAWRNYYSGLIINDSNMVSVNNSQVLANNYYLDKEASAIAINNVKNLFLMNSVITASGVKTGLKVSGLQLFSNSHATIKNTQFLQQLSGSYSSAINIATYPGFSSSLDIDHSKFTTLAEGDGTNAQNISLAAYSKATITNSSFTADTSSVGSNENTAAFQLYDHSLVNMFNSSVRSSAHSVSGQAAASNFFLYNDSRLNLSYSHLYAFGSCALVTGNTGITLRDNAVATIIGGKLEAEMSGGPSTGEPSAAVTVWALDNSKVSIALAQINAYSGNKETPAAAVQTQDNSIVNITNSYLSAFYNYGNLTGVPSSTLISANNSQINLDNSKIALKIQGQVNSNVILLSSINESRISSSSSFLQLLNTATPKGATDLHTYIAFAKNSSLIYLNNNLFYLKGFGAQLSGEEGQGEVIILN